MKTLAVIFILVCLGGCATTTTKPPAGCEDSFVWQSGFMPNGKELVELSFAALLTAEPKIKNQVKSGALKGWRLVQEGSLRGALGELMVVLEKNPQYAPLALFALQRLDLDKTLDACDQDVLLTMFRNIATYAGAGAQDFSASLAGLVRR